MAPQRLYTVNEVAELLGLHVKTVRGYVRDGRLKGTRVGKSYRIAAGDLATFTGESPEPSAREAVSRARQAEVTTVVQVEAADPNLLSRIDAMLGAAMVENGRAGGEPLRVDTVYDEERARLKVVLLGGLEPVTSALRVIAAIVEEGS
ncbi:helix-turn-helix domain-containing protein [Prauserella muralis]|uniref:MerR family transcriptional regulator n=1 Tax=Prauserella muralis TaxID=588067 RepID=A0A2V4ANP6_9PSEU|nr:helix-turn-helix domain-containing protein [Prauserella muralis]PXY20746.1 MerR family transcriptional regulator [Prauserella muralis]TWE29756.1 excisionase family DNA binding protein [Prauserella muralis]